MPSCGTSSDSHHSNIVQVNCQLPCLRSCLGCTKRFVPLDAGTAPRTVDCPIRTYSPLLTSLWPDTPPWLPKRRSRCQLRGSLATASSNGVTGNSFLNTAICPGPNSQKKSCSCQNRTSWVACVNGLRVEVRVNTSCTRFVHCFFLGWPQGSRRRVLTGSMPGGRALQGGTRSNSPSLDRLLLTTLPPPASQPHQPTRYSESTAHRGLVAGDWTTERRTLNCLGVDAIHHRASKKFPLFSTTNISSPTRESRLRLNDDAQVPPPLGTLPTQVALPCCMARA